jgi:hypothetical protein
MNYSSVKPEDKVQIDWERVSELIRDNIERLVMEVFPAGKKEGFDWRIGNTFGNRGKSLAISLVREKAGLWIDFATGEHGNFTELLIQHGSANSRVEAALWIGTTLGISVVKFTTR